MKVLVKIILTTATAFSILFTAIFSWVFISRSQLEYNEEGRYFDEDAAAVWHEQAVPIYGFVAFIGLIVAVILINLTIKKFKSVS